MPDLKLFQVSTLNALSLGYNRSVMPVREFSRHGTLGLGTYEGVDGEMIVLDGICYQADDQGFVRPADPETGVPFGVISDCKNTPSVDFGPCRSVAELKDQLMHLIDDAFELNSIHLLRLDGVFSRIDARSEKGAPSNHVELVDMLKKAQKAFVFEQIEGSVIAFYFPDYMEGLNAVGWHLHFISSDRTRGGHVFDLSFEQAAGTLNSISRIELVIPSGPVFDTYALNSASREDIKKAEQGDK